MKSEVKSGLLPCTINAPLVLAAQQVTFSLFPSNMTVCPRLSCREAVGLSKRCALFWHVRCRHAVLPSADWDGASIGGQVDGRDPLLLRGRRNRVQMKMIFLFFLRKGASLWTADAMPA